MGHLDPIARWQLGIHAHGLVAYARLPRSEHSLRIGVFHPRIEQHQQRRTFNGVEGLIKPSVQDKLIHCAPR